MVRPLSLFGIDACLVPFFQLIEPPVIPAKAGIQSDDSTFPKVCGVDSRFRGNDCGLQRPCLANDTSTQCSSAISNQQSAIENRQFQPTWAKR
jgi:hypothetical protein